MRGAPSYIGPFTGGLNTRDSVMELPYTHSPDLLNVIGGSDGAVRKRDPSRTINTNFPAAGANDIKSLFYSETQTLFVAAIGAKFYSVPTTGAASTDITGAFAPVANCKWCFVEAPTSGGQGPIYFTSNDGGPPTAGQWTGAGNIAAWTASAGALPAGDFMVYFKNRVIMGGKSVGTNGSGITASAVGDPRNWDTTASGSSSAWLTNIDPTDGMKFTGIGIAQSYLVAFKGHKTYLVYDLDTGANRPLSDSIGLKTDNWRTVVNTSYGLVWLAQDGHVYITNGTKIDKLSDVVGESTAGFGGNLSNQVTLGFPARLAVVDQAAGFFDDKYYLSITYNNATIFTFVYDFVTKTWWRFSGGYNQYTNCVSLGGSNGLAGGPRHPTGTQVPIVAALYLPGQNNTSGTGWQDLESSAINYNAYYCTPALSSSGKSNNPNIRKRFHAMRAFIAGNVDVQMASDVLGSNPPTYTTLDSIANTLVDFPIKYTAYSLGVANNVQFKFTSTNGFAWELHPFQLYTQPRSD